MLMSLYCYRVTPMQCALLPVLHTSPRKQVAELRDALASAANEAANREDAARWVH